jgi:hypothetical protein
LKTSNLRNFLTPSSIKSSQIIPIIVLDNEVAIITKGAVSMRAKCELLLKCGFFKNFKNDAGVLEMAWIRMYCESPETSESCERKLFRKQTGRPPADNMAPTGKML